MTSRAASQLEPAGRSEDKRGGAGLISIWGGILLLLYVLGTGPVFGLPKGDPPKLLLTIYSPLIYVADKCPPLGRFLDWWVELWDGHRRTKLGSARFVRHVAKLS